MEAKKQIKQPQIKNTQIIKQHVFTEHNELSVITEQLLKDMVEDNKQSISKVTVAVSDKMYFVGNINGDLRIYKKDTEELYATFHERGKEFIGNAITAIAVHPVSTQFVLIGYAKGQIVLIDTSTLVKNPNKSIKVLKDLHKNYAIINLQFCDLTDKAKISSDYNNAKPENPYYIDNVRETSHADAVTVKKQKEKDEKWFFVSIDNGGRVVTNFIEKIMFIMVSEREIIIDPVSGAPKFFSLACRFKSVIHPQSDYNDFITIIAIGSIE